MLFFAENGKEALSCLQRHDIDIMFLDLSMPVMDGFEVLKSLPVSKHDTRVVVLSADVQKQAMERCIELGASHFFPKPFRPEQLASFLRNVGVKLFLPETQSQLLDHDDSFLAFKDIANIALGRGAAIISDHFGEFIKMPLPNVARLTSGELAMAIHDIRMRNKSVAVVQRFVGGRIHGEALVCLRGKDIAAFGRKMGFSQMDEHKNEIVIDIANLMVSSFLVSLSEQIKVRFSVRQPIVLEDYMTLDNNESVNHQFFTVEYTYQAESMDLECDVLMMMDNSSTQVIKKMMGALH